MEEYWWELMAAYMDWLFKLDSLSYLPFQYDQTFYSFVKKLPTSRSKEKIDFCEWKMRIMFRKKVTWPELMLSNLFILEKRILLLR
jgi:hypothetical protein